MRMLFGERFCNQPTHMKSGAAGKRSPELAPIVVTIIRRKLCDKAADAGAHKWHWRQALNEFLQCLPLPQGITGNQHIQQGLMPERQLPIFGLLQHVVTEQ